MGKEEKLDFLIQAFWTTISQSGVFQFKRYDDNTRIDMIDDTFKCAILSMNNPDLLELSNRLNHDGYKVIIVNMENFFQEVKLWEI
jgi:hypothetical protein